MHRLFVNICKLITDITPITGIEDEGEIIMQKKECCLFAMAILAASILTAAAHSARINVNVLEMIDSEAKELNHDSYNNVLKISYDVMNSGSIDYGARVRLDIFNGTKYAATLWSKETALIPGERKTINMYWHAPGENETWTANARLYRAYEIKEIGSISGISGKGSSENTLEISSVRVYENEIKFRVKSRVDAKNIILYPVNYPAGWIFEQEEIGGIKAGSDKAASIHYETGAFREREITLIAVSEDGRNYGTKTFLMKKETGLGRLAGQFRDWLGI